MLRNIVTFTISIGIVGWIVLSYLPSSVVILPTIGFSMPWSGRLFAGLTVVSLILFIAIQVALVRSTALFVRPSARAEKDQASSDFELNRKAELFWTALPLAMTVALAVVCYQLWLSMSPS
jgi:hypothetical protein